MLAYIVTSGEYSDYHINGVFENESNAVTYIENSGNLYNEFTIAVWNDTKLEKELRLDKEGKIHVEYEYGDEDG